MKRLKTVLIYLCILVPVVSLIYKTQFLGLRLIPKKATTFWKVEMSLNWDNILRADSEEVEPPYVLPVPHSLPSQEVMSVMLNGKEVSTEKDEMTSSILQFGREGSESRTTILNFDVNTEFYDYINARDPSSRLDYEDRMRYLTMDNFDDETLRLLKKLSDTLAFHSDSIETKLEKFFFYLADEIVLKKEPHTVKDVVELASGSYLAQAQTLMGLARLNGIPSRIAFGIQILDGKASDKIRYSRMFFTEAFLDGQWIPLFPEKRLMGQVTGNQIVVHRDTENFASFLERRELLTILLDPVKFDPMSSKEQLQSLNEISSFWSIFSLHRFSLSIQSIFLGIVLIPFGTVVLSFARVFVGVTTFGIFMPILLTLFFLETSFVFGSTFLCLIVLVGLAQRALLDKFYLLAVPRLSILLALVILLYILFAIFADTWGILAVNNKTLNYFPIVIITVFIERFSIYYIEEGPSNTLKTSLGTFVVATACYYLLAFKWLKVFLFNHPEMLLLAIGLNLMIGSYRGYRLFELFRFSQLKEGGDGSIS